jgi:glycosyltransferase involved in cell wall biosynthesis
MKMAIVHDWFYTYGGAERVVRSMNQLWPESEIFALTDFLSKRERQIILDGKHVNTSFIQNLPTARRNHRKFLQWFPMAIERFDLSAFEVVLSSSSSVAKGILTNQNQLHICYCHSPARYAWDLYFQYLDEAGLNKGLKGAYARIVLKKFRTWDYISHPRVDHFLANSKYIAKRIMKVYGREAHVIYPPVNTEYFVPGSQKEDFYFTASRMVSYKKIDLIVKTFNNMPEKRLYVAGTGPELKTISAIAKKNITLLGFVEEEKLLEYFQKARGFVFMAEEDFGIVPLEAQACGTPVIGFGKGGLLETVINNLTGVLFNEQTIESLEKAVMDFEEISFDSEVIRKHATQFSVERFERELSAFVRCKIREFKAS